MALALARARVMGARYPYYLLADSPEGQRKEAESFFVRRAYFLGANDPYKALKAEIDPEALATLHSAVSRPFPKPHSGRIAVKVINHLGDEVMKVFRT